jgi:hypothetical protein
MSSLRGALFAMIVVGCSENQLSSITEPAAVPPDPDAPVADAGPDAQVNPGDGATLDGSGSSDPNGLVPLVYAWTLVSYPQGSSAQVDGLDTVHPTLNTDLAGDYTLELTVQNTELLWDETPDRVVITAVAPAVDEPVSDAGPDQEVAPLDTIELDGTASYDPAGLDLTAFKWTIVSQPAGSTSTLSNANVARPNLFADLAGDYVLELDVQNSAGVWDSTPDAITVTAVPLDNFYVQLSWNSAADLDLHLMEEGGRLFDSPTDCNYCETSPAWGAAGATDNPSLDWDAIFGYGPETITIEAPANGEYTIAVHYYGKDGQNNCSNCPQSEATVDIYIDGTIAASYTNTLSDDGDVWTVATLDWPSGNITDVDSMGSTDKITCF